MKIFLSWSGERSKTVAEALRVWLPRVLQAVQPWLSEQDISTGTRWSSELTKELEGSRVGIVCLTPENMVNPWVMFEAGALSKTFSSTYVCPYLFALTPPQMIGPMSQFQATLADKTGTQRLVQTLNKALGEGALQAGEMDEVFEVWWPRLEAKLQQVPEADVPVVQTRTTEEVLGEVLQNTREQLRREEIRVINVAQAESKLDGIMKLISSQFDNAKSLTELMTSLHATGGQPDNETMLRLRDTIRSMPKPDLEPMLDYYKELREEGKDITKQLLQKDESEGNSLRTEPAP